MYRELNPASKRTIELNDFVIAYRDAEETATLRSLEAGSPEDAVLATSGDARVVAVPIDASTRSPSARSKASSSCPSTTAASPGTRASSSPACTRASTWKARSSSRRARRSSPPTARRSPRARREARAHPLGSAAIDVTGEVGAAEEDEAEALARQGFPPDTPVGVSGLEQAFNARLAGKPGGSLLAGRRRRRVDPRTLAEAEPEPGAPVKTTIDPDLQEAAVSALAGRVGGIAVLDARNGDVRALAGQAFSAPQPPGSTFKMITTTAALQKGVVSLDDEFEITNGVNVGGRFIENANGEYCGGTFRRGLRRVVQRRLRPARAEDRQRRTGRDRRTLRLQLAADALRAADRRRGRIRRNRRSRPRSATKSTSASARSARARCWRRRCEMASVAQTIGNDGVREPTSIVANTKLRPEAKPVRVMSKKIADELTELMIGVVTERHRHRRRDPRGAGRGQDRHRRARPRARAKRNRRTPQQIKDAWFAAFAPAEKAKLAVGVLLIEAEAAGGEVAAPAASQVLSAGL